MSNVQEWSQETDSPWFHPLTFPPFVGTFEQAAAIDGPVVHVVYAHWDMHRWSPCAGSAKLARRLLHEPRVIGRLFWRARLARWLPWTEGPPEQPGVYETAASFTQYQFWDGSFWWEPRNTPDEACSLIDNRIAVNKHKTPLAYRGIVSW